MADIVPVQNKGTAAELMQALFQRVRQGRFSRTGQTSEPQDVGFVLIKRLPPRAGHSGFMPDSITAFFHTSIQTNHE